MLLVGLKDLGVRNVEGSAEMTNRFTKGDFKF